MTLATPGYTQAVLDLEDDAPDVLFETPRGASVPLWPQVRMNLVLALSAIEMTSVAVETADSRARILRRAARSVLPSRWDAGGLRASRDIAFLTSGMTSSPTPAGMRNWLIGGFAEAFPDDSVILQWRDIDGRGDRPAFPLTRTLDPLLSRAEIRTRLRPPPGDPDGVRALVAEFARRLGGIRADQLEQIQASAVYAVRTNSALEREFDAVIERIRPKVVLFDTPVDGGWGGLIALMKARGIHVAEPQHGWIGPGHGAYNYGAAMRRPELAAELPDELLTFGRYWSEGLRYPATITTIGKPHFEEAAAAAPPVSERPREVLVVSSVGDPDRTTEFVLALASALPSPWVVRFRPHPIERAAMRKRYPRLVGAPGILLDERADVYDALAATRIVVGVASTVLFEAVGFDCRVFVRETPYVPYVVGDLFGDALSAESGIERVVAAARDDAAAGAGTLDPATFWQPDAMANYRSWVAERRGGTGSPA